MNFSLGTELMTAGQFIFNGLRANNEIKVLSNSEIVFDSLYGLSVGMERLLKICVILLEDDNAKDIAEIEKSLITHNHIGLLSRIEKLQKLDFGRAHYSFLKMLSSFYEECRYHRFGLPTSGDIEKEINLLIDFLNSNFKYGIQYETLFGFGAIYEPRHKLSVEKCVRRISSEIYQLIHDSAWSKQLFYELPSESKAAYIFLNEASRLYDLEIARKELIVYLINAQSESRTLEFIRSIQPLELDPGLCQDYVRALCDDNAMISLMDEIEAAYEEIEEKRSRIEMLKDIERIDFDLDES